MHHWAKTRCARVGSRRAGLPAPPPPPPFQPVTTIWNANMASQVNQARMKDLSNYWRDLFQREMLVQRLEGVYSHQNLLHDVPYSGASPLHPHCATSSTKTTNIFLMSWANSHLLEQLNPDEKCDQISCLHCGSARRPNSAPVSMDLGSGCFAIRMCVSSANASLVSLRLGTFFIVPPTDASDAPLTSGACTLMFHERLRRCKLTANAVTITEDLVDEYFDVPVQLPISNNNNTDPTHISVQGELYSQTELALWIHTQLTDRSAANQPDEES